MAGDLTHNPKAAEVLEYLVHGDIAQPDAALDTARCKEQAAKQFMVYLQSRTCGPSKPLYALAVATSHTAMSRAGHLLGICYRR